MKYTEEFLLFELKRFSLDNNRSPTARDFVGPNYPNFSIYQACFGSWNNALKLANLSLNIIHKRTGTETCVVCGEKILSRISGLTEGKPKCSRCYEQQKTDMCHGNLNPKSSTGKGFISQRIVSKTLGINLEYDCNCYISFKYPYDLYSSKLGRIDVKSSKLHIRDSGSSRWNFGLGNKNKCDLFIMVGFQDKNIKHVWHVPSKDKVILSNFIVNNNKKSLSKFERFEVKVEPYNETYRSMSIENCNILKS